MPVQYIKKPFGTAKAMVEKMEQYAKMCRTEKRFANMAGFARFCGSSKDEIMSYQPKYRREFKMIEDILEDEALQNGNKTAGVYLKTQYGYTEKPEAKRKDTVEEIWELIDKLPEAERKVAYEEISGATAKQMPKIIKKYEAII